MMDYYDEMLEIKKKAAEKLIDEFKKKVKVDPKEASDDVTEESPLKERGTGTYLGEKQLKS